MTGPAASAASPEKRDRRWWIRMSVASAVLVALAAGVLFSAPAVALHWHAWRYRTRRDDGGESLKHVVDWAVRTGARRSRVVDLLGAPTNDIVPGGAGRDVAEYYLHGGGGAGVGGYAIYFRNGAAVSSSPIRHGPPAA